MEIGLHLNLLPFLTRLLLSPGVLNLSDSKRFFLVLAMALPTLSSSSPLSSPVSSSSALRSLFALLTSSSLSSISTNSRLPSSRAMGEEPLGRGATIWLGVKASSDLVMSSFPRLETRKAEGGWPPGVRYFVAGAACFTLLDPLPASCDNLVDLTIVCTAS